MISLEKSFSIPQRGPHHRKSWVFTTYNNELVVSFDGFEDHKDIIEFADFVFAKIRMRYWHQEGVPTFH